LESLAIFSFIIWQFSFCHLAAIYLVNTKQYKPTIYVSILSFFQPVNVVELSFCQLFSTTNFLWMGGILCISLKYNYLTKIIR